MSKAERDQIEAIAAKCSAGSAHALAAVLASSPKWKGRRPNRSAPSCLRRSRNLMFSLPPVRVDVQVVDLVLAFVGQRDELDLNFLPPFEGAGAHVHVVRQRPRR